MIVLSWLLRETHKVSVSTKECYKTARCKGKVRQDIAAPSVIHANLRRTLSSCSSECWISEHILWRPRIEGSVTRKGGTKEP